MNYRYSIFAIFFFIIAWLIYADVLPPPPTGSVQGGTFAQYFSNIIQSCPVWQVVQGFDTTPGPNYGKRLCSAVASASAWLWKNGTDGTSVVFTWGKVGIGTDSPDPTKSLTVSGVISSSDPRWGAQDVVTLGYLNSALLAAGYGGGGGGRSQRRAFMTSTYYYGNLNGLAGADAACTDRATAWGLSGKWIAALWGSNIPTSIYTRLWNDTYDIVDLHGHVIVSYDELFGPTNKRLSNGLSTMTNEFSLLEALKLTWGVNLGPNGLYTCRDWTSALSNEQATLSFIGAGNLGFSSCDIAHQLICLEERVPITPPTNNPGKCGIADGVEVGPPIPVADLCAAGSQLLFPPIQMGAFNDSRGNWFQSYSWACKNDTTVQCATAGVIGSIMCGSSHGIKSASPPTTNLCRVWDPSYVQGTVMSYWPNFSNTFISGPFTWTCTTQSATSDCKTITPECHAGEADWRVNGTLCKTWIHENQDRGSESQTYSAISQIQWIGGTWNEWWSYTIHSDPVQFTCTATGWSAHKANDPNAPATCYP